MGNQMINYSVYMLSNQMNKDEAPKAYAKAQVKQVMSFRQFVDHIAEHGGHKRGQVKGVLSDMCSCLVEQLLEGKKILLDELGDFWLSLSSTGADSCDAFTAKNITGVNILFTPGEDFQNLIGRAEFNLVASRTAQAATLKAEKAGESTVDLAAAKNKGTSSTPTDPTDPSDPTSPGGGGSSTDNENPDSGSDSGSGSGTDNTGGSGSDDPNNTDTPPFS